MRDLGDTRHRRLWATRVRVGAVLTSAAPHPAPRPADPRLTVTPQGRPASSRG